jgi:hypothetical protein
MPDDPKEWFTNPEHDHVVDLDIQLANRLRSELHLLDIEIDCGVEGKGPYTYHFRIRNVADNLRGHVVTRAIDILSAWTPYRYEVTCV